MATIKDVAKEAGVSKTLVSRYLNGQPGVSARSREKIEAAIRNVNYRPNALARSLVLRETRTIGVLANDLANPFIQPLIQGLESGVGEEAYTLIYTASSGNSVKKERQLKYFTQGRVDGVIVYGSLVRDEALLRDLAQSGFPCVLIENDLACDVPKVLVNNRESARQAAGHLLDCGCRNLVHIGGKKALKITMDRAEGFSDALRARGLSPEGRVIFPDFSRSTGLNTLGSRQEFFDAGYFCVKDLLEAGNVPDGLFFATDLSALGAIRALQEAGLKVPENVCVVGFDDEWIAAASLSMAPVTSVRQPLFDEGFEAVKMMLKVLKGEPVENKLLETRLILRSSTRQRT